MNLASGTPVGLVERPGEIGGKWSPEPFLHVGPRSLYNPLTDRRLATGDEGFGALMDVLAGVAAVGDLEPLLRRRLVGDGWLVPAEGDPSRRFLLKHVSLETHTLCNQSCYFCPVSVAPRESHFMPTELYERIVGELAAYRDTLEGVFLMSYNEPTMDRRFLDQCRALLAAGLPAAVNTNGAGLTPARADALAREGPLRFLSVNLSTADRERYRRERGQDQLDLVLANLEHCRDLPVAEEMVIVVLGTGDEAHRRDFEAIGERFSGSRFDVQLHRIMDRAGYLQIGLKPARPNRRLCGCENLGSRPLQHLHITPHGRCVLCCEDYDEQYVVGDLNESSVDEVLTGDRLALYRRWIYGLEEAPADFLCRGCLFARIR